MKYRPRVCKLRVLAALLILKRAGIHEPGIVNLILRLSFPKLIGTCLKFDEVRKIEAEAKVQLDVFADDTEVAFQESMNWLVSHGAQLGASTRNAGLTECMDQWRTSLASIPWNL